MSEPVRSGAHEEGTDATPSAAGQPMLVDGHNGSTATACNNAPKQKQHQSLTGHLRLLYHGWTEWKSKQRDCALWVLAGIVVCIILLAVVPPVCKLHGCGAGRHEPVEEDGLLVKRLLVQFDELGKTVKSKVSPLLYGYFEEIVLSFGVNVVAFNSSRVLYEVQRILEKLPDVRILLLDRPQYRIPDVDPFANVSLRAPEAVRAAIRARLRRQMQAGPGAAGAGAGAAGVELGDSYIAEQWSLDRVAARDAWEESEGARVVVAVIDTGCDLNHPDLKNNIWVNRDEAAGVAGKDDDLNKYVDDINGYDFSGPCESNTGPGCGPQPSPQDSLGHGSHCAGIIGAVRNNGVGIAGVAPNVAIMCLKVTPNNGRFYLGPNLMALDYAITMGAHIVSCSFGPDKAVKNPDPKQLDEAALYNAAMEKIKQKNMLLVAAAGNELTNIDDVPYYNPCTLTRNYTDNALCVMATDDLDKKLQTQAQGESKELGSNFGTRTVSIAAPGLQILSTVPPLFQYNQLQWYNLSGTSMATPLVAGVAALVMSILGSKDGNFYKGTEAKAVIMDSGVPVEGLEVQRSQRVSASGAVRMATARLSGMYQLTSNGDFDPAQQTALMQGFNMAYYRTPSGPPRPEDQPPETNLLAEGNVLVNRVTRFDGYKMGIGTTLVITAKVNLTRPGMYLLKINTTAKRENVAVYVGQVQLRNLSDVFLIKSNGSGWYDFVLRYVDPVAPIDVRLAEPPSGGAPALRYLPSVFYTATDTPPNSFSYAPQIALSSTWQVLTRRVNGALNWSSILPSALQLTSLYDTSAAVEALNFTNSSSAGGALYTALGLSSSRVVGLAYTRMRAPYGSSSSSPGGQLCFQITCELCMLYVNGLRVADVYDPVQLLSSPATQRTNCVVLGSSVALHDLVLRFGLNNVSASAATTSLVVGWLPCDGTGAGGGGGAQALPLGPLLMNNLLWKPSSGVAGYVGGMQCDMWLTGPQPGGDSDSWQPFFKFRLPTALAQTKGGLAYDFEDETGLYDIFIKSRCTPNETSVPACRAGSGFKLRDLIARGGFVSTKPLFLRCWTYVNAGLSDGTLVSRVSGTGLNVYLGPQTLPVSSSGSSSSSVVYQGPSTTALAGYHQLLVLEFATQTSSLSTLCSNGTQGAPLVIDMTRTLLPLPLLGSGAAAAAAGAAAGGRRRRQAQQVAAVPPPPAAAPPPPAAAVFSPRQLGDSPYSLAQLAGPGMCGLTFTPNSDYTIATFNLTSIAAYNISLTARSITGSPCGNASAGLSGPVCAQVPGRNFPRYVQFPGFLRVPAVGGGGGGGAAAAAAGGAWALRVFDDVNQVTAITVGDVTVRNGMDFPASGGSSGGGGGAAGSETLLYLPSAAVAGGGGGGGGRELYLPAVVSARSKYGGAQAWFNVTLVGPDRRVAVAVDSTRWLRTSGATWMCMRPAGNGSSGGAT